MKFAPIHIYSTYSFLKSGLTIEKIANAVRDNNYFGVGISDISVMYGVPKFVLECEKINKPFIVGVEIEIENNFYSLYATNENGYKNLSFISSSIAKKEFSLEILKNHSDGITAVLDTHDGEIASYFKEDKINEDVRFYLAKISEIFNNFYLGIEISSKEDRLTALTIREFASNYCYDLVAFPKIKYAKSEDAIILKIVNAIDNDETLDTKEEKGTEYFYSENQYLKLYTEEEIENTVKIVSSSTFSLHQKRGELIHYPCEDSKIYLKELINKGLKDKQLENNQDYISRMEYEYEIICQMGYEDYFLVVQDYVNYAKRSDILVGPGRGSAAGSLVSYLLNITEVDPLKYGLQFERFLNPDRKTMPDIDIDFMDIRRDEVVDYVRSKYGENKVANIITFQTILAKQALRDIGRVYQYSNFHIDKLSKCITDHKLSLRESYKKLPAFKELVDSDKLYLEIVSLASKIEGLIRQSGVHAAGVILNNLPIENDMPISIDLSDNYISQYEMHYLEEQGFLKMDFLGIRNLSIIARCIEIINLRAGKEIINKFAIPYDNPKTYQLIASCLTMGVFQLESSGMKRAIKEIKPNCFNDVVALLALFRPGPMESIPTYARRKEGKEKITYISKDLEEILKETYGIIVYQEQINQIATKMAGFTPGEADTFRRAISKKQIDLLASTEESFINGATKKGYSQKEAKTVYDHILKFANYGFNKSHSVGYAIVACQMAYLKSHYPLEFYAAILENSSATNDSKFNEYVTEMKNQNIKILPPSIHTSKLTFSIENDSLLFPLGAIKGVNDVLANKIIQERNKPPFIDFFDFVGRMNRVGLSETQLEKLIDSGALDCFSSSRQSMRKSILHAFQSAKILYSEDGQLSLNLGIEQRPMLYKDNDDPLENLDKEYQVLGIMLSNNPLHYKKDLLVARGAVPIIEAMNVKQFAVAGIIKTIKVIHTKKGLPMAFIKIFDETGEMEITIFPNLYSTVISLIEKNNIIVVKGKRDFKNDEVNYLADEISLLEEE